MKPKQIVSKLRDNKEIPEKYIPPKQQIALFSSTTRKKLVETYLENNKESVANFIKEHAWEKIENERNIVCLYANTNPDNFLLIITSKALMTNIIQQNSS